jgi:ATP-dependent Clp protease ATP-binding subunit ClpX
MATMDMSSLSKTGLVGNSIIQGIRNLVFECGGDVKAAQEQPTILLCDEIDKIRQATANDANQGVQDEFLSMLSGKQVTVPSESAYDRSYVFDTSKIIFICCGAFSELFEARKQDNKQMGFAPSAPKNVFRPVTTEDFKKSGIKPEVIRRLETIVTIRNLDEEDLYKLVTTSKISHLLIKEDAFLKHDNVVVYREPEYAHKVAEVAKKEDIGASGIKRVVERSLRVATRTIRLLNGAGGTLVLSRETVTDPTRFELYKLDGEKVYPKVKRIEKG